MGNREVLLEGAKRCLYERGYARTTTRDIVAASGGNLGSIGYHYGSKEALLDAALLDAIGELGERLLQLSGSDPAGLPEGWDRVMAEFKEHRPLLVAHVEAWAQIERSPDLRQRFRDFYAAELSKGAEHARALLPGLDIATARAVANVTNLLADGLVVQCLADPQELPSGKDIATGLRALANALDPQEQE